MTAENSYIITLPPTLQVLAQAYGTSSYSSNTYNGQPTTTSEHPPSLPLPPNTGFPMQSPALDIPLLFILAVAAGSISFVISRKLRQRRQS